LARLDGKPAVVLQVQAAIGREHGPRDYRDQKRLATSEALLPEDVSVTVIQDQSRYILAALHEIEGPPGRRQHSGHDHGAAVHEIVALGRSSPRWRFRRR